MKQQKKLPDIVFSFQYNFFNYLIFQPLILIVLNFRKSGGPKSHVDSPLAQRKNISKKKSKKDDNDESENSSDGLFTFFKVK